MRETETQSSPREKTVLAFVGNYPGCKSGQIAGKLAIPSPTVKRTLADLPAQHRLTKEGKGPATIYYVS